MDKNIQLLLDKAKELGWDVQINNKTVTFGRFSPYGRDFSFDIDISDNVEDFLHNIYEYYENYDVSYETYIWLDDNGHGTNGAPYDMKDLYEDTEECEKYIKDLYGSLNFMYRNEI